MSIAEEADGRLAVTSIARQLDVQSASAVYQQAMASIADYPTVILDLSGVTFCDSSGFNALLRLRRRALEARSGLVLAARLLR
ncbi:STAS domain-containing protein (plasmid) [Streptomyces sp. G6]|uniref:STAS domain-containing protein n=1 Tax=Streptomyces sp. G6 TaxID=1178736 RepID=UPI003ED9ADE5